MTRCTLCTSPESPKGCTNADCARWEGPTPSGAPVPSKSKREALERLARFTREGLEDRPTSSIERLVAATSDFGPSEEELDAEAIEDDRRFEQYRDDQREARRG